VGLSFLILRIYWIRELLLHNVFSYRPKMWVISSLHEEPKFFIILEKFNYE
jgi:hypothetical protein